MPTRLSIFPLPGAILFPGLHLPLHVFEPRYRALVGLNLADGDKEHRVEAGELVPVRFNEQLPADWIGRKVEET